MRWRSCCVGPSRYEEDDRRYGKDRRGGESPEELAFRAGRLENIQGALGALEAEAVAERAATAGKDHPGAPDDKAQRNFTDAESRITPGPRGRDCLQACSCQAVVDNEHQVIVAARATGQTSGDGNAGGDHRQSRRGAHSGIRWLPDIGRFCLMANYGRYSLMCKD